MRAAAILGLGSSIRDLKPFQNHHPEITWSLGLPAYGTSDIVLIFGGDGTVSPLAPLTHLFTHFKLNIEPRIAELDRGAGALAALADSDTAWVALSDLDSFGVPAPVRKLLDGLQGSLI